MTEFKPKSGYIAVFTEIKRSGASSTATVDSLDPEQRRMHVRILPGKHDIVFRRKHIAIFIDSDFWHGHPERFIPPKSNVKYWESKIARNRARDLEVNAALVAQGWTVLRLWEWDILHDFDICFARLLAAIGRASDTD